MSRQTERDSNRDTDIGAVNDAENTDSELKQIKKANKKIKITILIVAACMAVFIPLAVFLIDVIDGNAGSTKEIETRKSRTILFVEPDYDLDIMKDSEYLGLNRTVLYTDNYTGVTEVIDGQNKRQYGDGAALIYDMIQSVIAGNCDAYNACFSREYLDEEGPEEEFTMQQLYDIKITMTKRSMSDDGRTYDSYTYEVEYKINKNNGTYRTDIGHDESRPIKYVVTNRTGSMKIDSVITTTSAY